MKYILNLSLVIVITSVFIVLINILLGHGLNMLDYRTIILFTMFYGLGNYIGINFFLYILNRIWKKEGQEKTRLIIGIIFSIFISIVITTLVNIFILIEIEKKSMAEIWDSKYFISYYLIPILISIIITLIYFISYFYKTLYQTKNKTQELVIQKISSQYEGLQQQLSPHFLFNSLNVLDSLIEEHPKSAQEFTQELSQIYRYVLEQQSNDFTTIKEELKFVKNYINLMSKRFENIITIVISEKINAENKILPLSIQLLIENVFKHNRMDNMNPLKIEIYQEEDNLVVKNTLIPKKNRLSTCQKGLINIRERYQKLGLSINIEKTENHFIVKLPIINKNYTSIEYRVEEKEQSEKKVNKLKKFYLSLNSYIIAVLICTTVNLISLWDKIFTNTGINFNLLWVMWVIILGGIVLLSKAINLFWLSYPKYKHIKTIAFSNINQNSNNMETRNNQRMEAQTKVEELKGFYKHLISYIIVNCLLLLLNLIQIYNYGENFTFRNFWVLWVIGGWGIGIFSHYLQVKNISLFLGKNWEEKKFNEILKREANKDNN